MSEVIDRFLESPTGRDARRAIRDTLNLRHKIDPTQFAELAARIDHASNAFDEVAAHLELLRGAVASQREDHEAATLHLEHARELALARDQVRIANLAEDDLVIELARAGDPAYPAQAEARANRALDENDPETAVRHLHNIAMFQRRHGEPSDARESIYRALRLTERLTKTTKRWRSRLNYQLGMLIQADPDTPQADVEAVIAGLREAANDFRIQDQLEAAAHCRSIAAILSSRLGRHGDALRLARSAVTVAGDGLGHHLWLAWMVAQDALVGLGRHNEAIGAALSAQDASTDIHERVDAVMRAAQIALDIEDHDTAGKLLDQASAVLGEPTEHDVEDSTVELAILRAEHQRVTGAPIEAIAEALRNPPPVTDDELRAAFHFAATGLLRNFDRPEALWHAEQTTAAGGLHRGIHIVELLSAEGLLELAADVADVVAASATDSNERAEVANTVAIHLGNAGSYDQAAALFRQALHSADIDDVAMMAAFRFNLAETLRRADRPEEALEVLEPAAVGEFNLEEEVGLYNLRGALLLDVGDLNAARDQLAAVLTYAQEIDSEERGRALVTLGLVELESRNTDVGLGCLRDALALDGFVNEAARYDAVVAVLGGAADVDDLDGMAMHVWVAIEAARERGWETDDLLEALGASVAAVASGTTELATIGAALALGAAICAEDGESLSGVLDSICRWVAPSEADEFATAAVAELKSHVRLVDDAQAATLHALLSSLVTDRDTYGIDELVGSAPT